MFKNLKNINVLNICLAILIMFIPLYPKFPLLGIKNTYVAIRLDDIIIALVFFFLLINQIKHRFPLLKLKITYLFIAYFLALLLSAINAILIFQIVPKNILLLNTFRRFEYMSVFFLTISAIKNKKDSLFHYYFLILANIVVCIYGFGQKYFNLPVVSTMNAEFSKGQLLTMNAWTRISSTFAGHYDLAAYLSISLIIIGSVFLLSKNKLTKILSLITWLLCFQILNLTASRISTFAFWGGITLAFIFIKKYLWIIPVAILMIFSIVNSKDLNQRLLATIPTIKHQIETPVTPIPTTIPSPTVTIKTKPTITVVKITPIPTIVRHAPEVEFEPVDADVGVARSGEIRFNAEWPRAINAFKRNPLLGSGPGSITLATDNDYLRSLGESGIFGFLTFFIIFVYFALNTLPFLKIFKRNLSQNLSLVFLACLIPTLANAIFIDVFVASKFAYSFWILMGFYYLTLIDAKNSI